MKLKLHIGDKAKRLFKVMADNASASAMTLFVVFVFILFPLSFSRFNTAQTMREQYNLMDAYNTIYNLVTEKRPFVRTSDEIVIVDISDMYDRSDLARMLKSVVDASPKVIGLDVTFYERKDEVADALLDSLASLPKVISPCLLMYEEEDRFFHVAKTSFYNDSHDCPNVGFVNVELLGATRVCRTFSPKMYCGEDSVMNFAALVAKIASLEAYEGLLARSHPSEYINYDRTGFTDISAFYVEENTGMLEGKIVLIGDKEDLADRYMTPIDASQPGVEIHAHVVDTILHDKYIDVMSEPTAWILAYLVIFLAIPFNALLRRNTWTSLFIPVFQTFLILVSVFVGYWIFASCHYYVRVVYAMLGIGFMEVGVGLYNKLKLLIFKNR